MPFPPKRVRDTSLHRVFPSLNQCYLALLREGQLEEMRRAGKLTDFPEGDRFGYYKMRRFYPGRFVQEDEAGWQGIEDMTEAISKEHLDILRQGVQTWNNWREMNPGVIPVLRKAKLRGINLDKANLSSAKLAGADLAHAHLRAALLDKADLAGADLSGAGLYQADLSGADLTDANLDAAYLREARAERATFHRAFLTEADASYADLKYADLRGANLLDTCFVWTELNGADLHGAILRETVFGNTNLSGVRGLESCRHLGPSVVDHRTLVRSGRLPSQFLRGCGVPDDLIAHFSSLWMAHYSCFISYSMKDRGFAERLHADLQRMGIPCWFDAQDMRVGTKIARQINQAIQLSDLLLLVLSEHSMNSEWVKMEIAKARDLEVKEGRRVLCPIRLVDFETIRKWECIDAGTGRNLAQEIREHFILDFSNWKGEKSYKQAFSRLVRDLTTSASLASKDRPDG